MRQESVSQDGRAAPTSSFDALVRTIAQVQEPPSQGFVALLEMRASERFANQDIAALISRDPEFGVNLQASHLASTLPGPSERPFSARDAIDHWGYRIIHSSSVSSGIVRLLGEDAFDEPHHEFWFRAFATASYAGILAEVLDSHDDRAFSGSLLRSASLFLMEQHAASDARAARLLAISSEAPLWEAQTELLGGNYLDLGRHLCQRCDLSETFIEVFNPAGQPNSLPDILLRADAAAERHGFQHPDGPTVPLHLRPDREPILDAYFRNSGGTTDGILFAIRGMLAITPLVSFDPAA